jgi:hypothetical protein
MVLLPFFEAKVTWIQCTVISQIKNNYTIKENYDCQEGKFIETSKANKTCDIKTQLQYVRNLMRKICLHSVSLTVSVMHTGPLF